MHIFTFAFSTYTDKVQYINEVAYMFRKLVTIFCRQTSINKIILYILHFYYSISNVTA
jgi:hypothetical protein